MSAPRRLRVEVEFAIIPVWLLEAPVSAHAIRIYGVLALLGYKGQPPHKSYKELGDAAHVSAATAKRAVKELTDLGAVEIRHRVDARGQDSNEYLVKVNTPLVTGDQPGLVVGDQGPLVTGDQPKDKAEKEQKEKDLAPSRRERKRDELFEAVMEVSGIDLVEIPDEARGSYNAALAGLRKLGATPEEVRRRAPRAWFTVTPAALLRHWAELRGGPRTSRSSAIDEPCEECRGRTAHRAWCSQSGWPESPTVPLPQESELSEEGTA